MYIYIYIQKRKYKLSIGLLHGELLSLSLSLIRYAWYVILFCLLWVVVVDKKEKRRALRFTWLCYLVYVDFASSWLDLTLILIESTFTWYDIYVLFFIKHITKAKWNHGWGWEWLYSSPGSTLSSSDYVINSRMNKIFVLFCKLLFFRWKIV